jgi:predicted Rdx family selenoprotein
MRNTDMTCPITLWKQLTTKANALFDEEELKQIVRDRVAPGRHLGHSDQTQP